MDELDKTIEELKKMPNTIVKRYGDIFFYSAEGNENKKELAKDTEKWKEISKDLRYKRLFYNMTQKEVAEEAGISIKVVQKIESDCEKVNFANIYAYLTVVDVNAEELLKSVLKPLGAFKKDMVIKKQKRVRGR